MHIHGSMSLSVVPEELALLLNSGVPGHVKLPESTSSGSRVWLPFFFLWEKHSFQKGSKFLTFPKDPRGRTKSKNVQVRTHSISCSSLIRMFLCAEQMRNEKAPDL